MTIHIEPGSQPITGWIQHADAERQEFQGMIELIQLLDGLRAAGSIDLPADDRRSGDR